MTASLTNPVKSHLCDLQMPRPDTHHDVQQERSLRTLLRDTNSRCTDPGTSAADAHLHFAASLHCFLWKRKQILGLPFALSCHKVFLCFLWKSSNKCAPLESCPELFPLWSCSCRDLYHFLFLSLLACPARRVAVSEHAVLAENESADCEKRQLHGGAKQPRPREPERTDCASWQRSKT